MKKVIFLFLVLGLLPLDLTAAPSIPLPTGGFNGLYIGGNVGVFSRVIFDCEYEGIFKDYSSWIKTNTVASRGLQIGYDLHFCNLLFGLAADWNKGRLKNKSKALVDESLLKNELNWFSTIRARAGITLGSALIYLTGGAAAAKFENKWQSNPLKSLKDHKTSWGWTVGAGVESLLFCNLSIGAEFLFLHCRNKSKLLRDEESFSYLSSRHLCWTGRIVLNYRLSSLFSL